LFHRERNEGGAHFETKNPAPARTAWRAPTAGLRLGDQEAKDAGGSACGGDLRIEKLEDEVFDVLHQDGLGQVGVETSGESACAVLGLAVTRQRHEQDLI